MGKGIVKTSVGVGAAALLGMASPGCGNDQNSTSPTTLPESQAESAESAQTEQAPMESPENTAEGQQQSSEPTPVPAEQNPESQSTAEQQASSNSAEEGSQQQASENQPSETVDCSGSKRFTEACGYASPTRYAVLDPGSIANE